MDTVKELVCAFREDERDAVAPFLWSDPQLLRWARQAVDRFCEITRSVYDSTGLFTTVDVRAGDECIPRHPCIIDIISASIDAQGGRDLDIQAPGQTPHNQLPRTGMTKLLVVGSGDLRLYPPAPEDFSLQLSVTRRPVRQLELDSRLADVPVSEREHLLLFIKHRAYRVNDADMFDPAKADNYLAEFERACQHYYETAQRARRSSNIKFRW